MRYPKLTELRSYKREQMLKDKEKRLSKGNTEERIKTPYKKLPKLNPHNLLIENENDD